MRLGNIVEGEDGHAQPGQEVATKCDNGVERKLAVRQQTTGKK